jgi:hypothetical protein
MLLETYFQKYGIEVVVTIWDDGTEEAIHSMRARKQYIGLLK